eukprot:55869-Eustigmatos_ZCMA.PRE.1
MSRSIAFATRTANNNYSDGLGSSSGTLTGLNVSSGVLYVDTSNNRVGVNTTAPASALHVSGAASVLSMTSSGQIVTGSLTSSGSITTAGLTTSTISSSGAVNLTGSLTTSGAVQILGNGFKFNGPQYTNSGQGIYLSMNGPSGGGGIPTVVLSSNTTNNRYIQFANASGTALASVESWTNSTTTSDL